MFRKTLFALVIVFVLPVHASDLLEPCLNPDVSATGSFPNQEMEDQIQAYLAWQSDAPYYLFRFASGHVLSPYPED